MALADVIADLQSKAGAMSGILAAPVNPPEAANQFPFAVCYPKTGYMTLHSAGYANYHHTIILEVHVGRQLLPQAIQTAIPYAERLAVALMNDVTLSGTVSEVKDLRYAFGRLEWGGVETIGYRFEVDVKLAVS